MPHSGEVGKSSQRVDERRIHARHPISTPARILVKGSGEHESILKDASASGLCVLCGVQPPIGTGIVVYSELLGRTEGEVVRHVPDGFAMTIIATPERRSRLMQILDWASARLTSGESIPRIHERVKPEFSTVEVSLGAEAERHAAQIKDISRSGVAVNSTFKPPIGSHIVIGSHRARVVRELDDGFAAEFFRLIPIEIFGAGMRL